MKGKCPNCGYTGIVEHEGHEPPLCPICKIERLTVMQRVECSCGGQSFRIEAPESITGAKATAICMTCNEKAEVDEDGLEWRE